MRSLLLASLLFYFPARAEYRVFLLQISSADGTDVKQIKSTLDPDQYRGYHPLKEGDRIFYTDTWMCRGRTSELPLCPSPRELASEDSENPASPPEALGAVETPPPPPPDSP